MEPATAEVSTETRPKPRPDLKGLTAANRENAKRMQARAAEHGMTVPKYKEWQKRIASASVTLYSRHHRETGERSYSRVNQIIHRVLDRHPAWKRTLDFDREALLAEATKLLTSRNGTKPTKTASPAQNGARPSARRRTKRRRATPKPEVTRSDDSDEHSPKRARWRDAQRARRARRANEETAQTDAAAEESRVHSQEREHISYAFGHCEEWLTIYARHTDISWPTLARGVSELLARSAHR